MFEEDQKSIYVRIYKSAHFSINGMEHNLPEQSVEKITCSMDALHDKCFQDDSIFAYQTFEGDGVAENGKRKEKNVSELTFFVTDIDDIEELKKRLLAKKMKFNCRKEDVAFTEDETWTAPDQTLLEGLYVFKDQGATHIASIRNEAKKVLPTNFMRLFNAKNEQVWPLKKRSEKVQNGMKL